MPGRARGGRRRPGRSPARAATRDLLGDDDRAVVAAGAADGRSSGASCPRRCRPGRRSEELLEESRNPAPPAGRGRTRGRSSVSPESGRRSGDVVGVLHEPDVEDEVCLERYAVLEAEADELEREQVRPRRGSRRANIRSRSCRSDRSEVSRTTSASARPDRAGGVPPRSSWRCPGRRRAGGGGASRRSAGSGRRRWPRGRDRGRMPRPSSAPRMAAKATVVSPERTSSTIAIRANVGGRPRRARRGRAAARPAGCRRPCSRGPRTAWPRRSCRHRTGR